MSPTSMLLVYTTSRAGNQCGLGIASVSVLVMDTNTHRFSVHCLHNYHVHRGGVQNAPEERYLLAREVVKASGVDYNTSAPNVVQRWFRAIMRRAKAHNLPLPSLPRRCTFTAPRHSIPAPTC